MPLFLREADVKGLLTMDLTLAALDAAFREWATGAARNQPRRRVAAGAVLATMSVCGSNIPDRREVDARTVARADIVVADDVEAARLEAGDLILAEREGQLSWGRVHSLREAVVGSTGPRQRSDVSLFKSVGLAIEDLAAGAAVLELAEASGVGQRLPD